MCSRSPIGSSFFGSGNESPPSIAAARRMRLLSLRLPPERAEPVLITDDRAVRPPVPANSGGRRELVVASLRSRIARSAQRREIGAMPVIVALLAIGLYFQSQSSHF